MKQRIRRAGPRRGLFVLMASLVLLSFVFWTPQVLARELASVRLPDTVQVGGETLVLNGAGVRTKLLFKVYVAGLYLKTPARDPAAVEQTPGNKLIVMHFLRDVDAPAIRQAWTDGIEGNCFKSCDAFQALTRELRRLMSDLRKGDTLTLMVSDNAVAVKHGDRDLGVIPGQDFGKMVLRIFLGPNPPTAGLKKGLLGGH